MQQPHATIHLDPGTIDRDSAIDEPHALISSARVQGTPVFDEQGEKLRTIHSVMIHKTTGRVAYALLAVGGFLGVGRHVHPIPWEMLDYHHHGYVVGITLAQLEAAPKLDLDSHARPRDAEQTMYRYWDIAPYW